MIRQAISPLLVGREEELSALEDALLAANRGQSRFVVLSGQAGIGKTRLATDVTARAGRINWTTMWGSCSEADLALPYLPLLEAVGNYLADADIEEVGRRLGGARRELAQLFPQLADGDGAAPMGEPSQAKLRLFESIVALLSIPAKRSGLLLVIEDIHWAESSTRELLDYLARRLRNLRMMVLVTYRKDELHRKHPLLPTVQGWRRSGLAEAIELSELDRDGVAEMIAAILDHPPSGELRDAMHVRSEGNPFVLEEMLREALDCGEIYRTEEGWQLRAISHVPIPETVRDTILLRVGRLDPADARVLESAAVLGRYFDYSTLTAITGGEHEPVQRALEAAVREQLVEDDPAVPGRFRWRHALTQEAIYTDIVLPRRQHIHSLAADFFATRGPDAAFDLAFHLSEAGRHDEAVPACLDGAAQALRRYAYADAVELFERALRHVSDPRERGLITCRLGDALWFDGRSARAERHLDEGIELLDSAGELKATGHFLITRGRCRWERSRPDLAIEDYERARTLLEPDGPSRDLAAVYIRLSGIHLFELDGAGAVEAAEKAATIAAEAGAEDARAWALGFVALGRFDGGLSDSLDILVDAYRLAIDHGYLWIALNHGWNEVWMRTFVMAPRARDALERLRAAQDGTEAATSWRLLAESYVDRTEGHLQKAADDALEATAINEQLGHGKTLWRSQLAAADALVELGRFDDAARRLPDISTRAELQDAVYDVRPRVRLAQAMGEHERALEAVQTIVAETASVGAYRFAVAAAVEVMLGAGDVDVCRRMIATSRSKPQPYGVAFLDHAEGMVELAAGSVERSCELLRRAAEAFATHECRLEELRTRVFLAEATARAGNPDDAAAQLQGALDGARRLGAELVASEAVATARRVGVELTEQPSDRVPASTEPTRRTPVGERLVTVMFADVRGYTAMTAARSPSEMAERITSLQRWAKQEVARHHGVIDKFAGDAVMATFNVAGDSIDHCQHAVEAALALRDKAALANLQLGVGIAVGPAIVGALVSGGNLSVLGDATNLAARLQEQAGPGEILLGEAAYKRVAPWVQERATRDTLTLKGLDAPATAYRIQT